MKSLNKNKHKKITLGDLAKDEFSCLILNPKNRYYGYVRRDKIYPPISVGGIGNLKFNVWPLELPNGERRVFTLPDNYVEKTTSVYLNGLRQVLYDEDSPYPYDYTEIPPNKIEFLDPPRPGDIIIVDYVVLE